MSSMEIVLSFNHIEKNRSMFVKKIIYLFILFFRVIEELFRVENDFIEILIVFFKCFQVKINEKYVFGVQKSDPIFSITSNNQKIIW